MKLIFCLQINTKLSYKLISLILVGMARPAQINQNKKFVKSLQYLRKKEGMKLFFCADEHHSYLEIDTIFFDGCDQSCLKYSK